MRQTLLRIRINKQAKEWEAKINICKINEAIQNYLIGLLSREAKHSFKLPLILLNYLT